MKKEFIINIILIATSIAVAAIAYMHSLWMCGAGASIACMAIVCRQIMLYTRFEKMLESERKRQRQLQKKLTGSEMELHFYKQLIDKVDAAVIIATDNGLAEWRNRAADKFIGNGESMPKEITDAVRENRYELTIDGTEYTLSSTRITSGGSYRNIVVLKDIHNSIEKSKVESWHKLVRVLTHEIMNSMTPIISLSSTLCDNIRNSTVLDGNEELESIRQGVEIINRRSSSLLSFVENYRKLTRLAAPQKEYFTIKEFVDELQRLYTEPFIRFRIEGCDNATINADRTQLEQVVINLIKNALEACAEKARCIDESSEGYAQEVILTFGMDTEEGNQKAIIEVKDNGIGIMTPAKEQIFVPFFTTKRNGSGIGLSLCKQIIVNHGGEIDVVSSEGEGCCVTISLPRMIP
jgi:nitrogen fixation/metabolism regulation signal transduction histidine kinase